MKILFCASYHDYAMADRGLSLDEVVLGDALRHLPGVDVVNFFFDVVHHWGLDVDREFLTMVERECPDVVFGIPYGGFLSPGAFNEARKTTVVISWGTDDHFQFLDGIRQPYAKSSDYCVTTHPPAVADYLAVGQPKVIISQWACNHHFFKPNNKGYLYDVSFVGQCYGTRQEVMDHLWRRGIEVKLFGRGWPRTRRAWQRGWRFTLFGKGWTGAEHAEPDRVVEIYGRSKINICLNNNKTDIENIKSRNFEVPGCRGFLISGPALGLEEFFEIGKEVVIYQDADDLADKILYYLAHDSEREEIAQAGYERVMQEHTYEYRFREIFARAGFPLPGRENEG